ncbi:MAG: DUF3987 domain-containing protein [Chitinophagaceae bacterium]
MKIETYELLNTTPTFSDQIYQNLPPLLGEITKHFTDKREKDIALMSSLTVLSACFSNLKGKYRIDWVNPNLFSFIVAPPASGKGVMKYSNNLGKAIQDSFLAENQINREKYAKDKIEWEKSFKDAKENSGSPAIKPKPRYLFIPGNTSSAALYSNLSNNGGIGIICETEADAMSSAISQNWGDFSQVLRCSFHHETINKSRSINDEYIYIERPRLSTLLSGTPDQVPRLISSSEDGLFSRFVFYCFTRKVGWLDPTPCEECVDFGEMFTGHSYLVGDLKTRIDDGNYIFSFTNEQFARMGPIFQQKLMLVESFEGYSAISVVYRLGLICFKIAMILSVLRKESWHGNHSIVCNDIDFETAMSLIDVFFEHSMTMYSLLPNRSDAEVNPRLRQLYGLLPENEIPRKEINKLAASIKVSERTVNNYVAELTKRGFLISPAYGIYQKTEVGTRARWKGW